MNRSEIIQKSPELSTEEKKIESLALQLGKQGELKILEGLFFEETGEYLALLAFGSDGFVHVVGDRFKKIDIPAKSLSSSRVLSRIVGSLLD